MFLSEKYNEVFVGELTRYMGFALKYSRKIKGEVKEGRRSTYTGKCFTRVMSTQGSLYYFLYFVYI